MNIATCGHCHHPLQRTLVYVEWNERCERHLFCWNPGCPYYGAIQKIVYVTDGIISATGVDYPSYTNPAQS